MNEHTNGDDRKHLNECVEFLKIEFETIKNDNNGPRKTEFWNHWGRITSTTTQTSIDADTAVEIAGNAGFMINTFALLFQKFPDKRNVKRKLNQIASFAKDLSGLRRPSKKQRPGRID